MNGPELTGTVLGPYLTIPHTASMYLSGSSIVCSLLLARNVEFEADVLGKKWTLKIVDLSIGQPVSVDYLDHGVWRPLCKSGTGPEAIAVSGSWGSLAAGCHLPRHSRRLCRSAAYKCKMELDMIHRKMNIRRVHECSVRTTVGTVCRIREMDTPSMSLTTMAKAGKTHLGLRKAGWGRVVRYGIDAYRFNYSSLYCKDRLVRGDCRDIGGAVPRRFF